MFGGTGGNIALNFNYLFFFFKKQQNFDGLVRKIFWGKFPFFLLIL